MRSLYWRIFLWFWAAMISIALITAWMTSTAINQFGFPPKQDILKASLITTAEHVLQKDGLNGFDKWRAQMEKDSGVRIFLLYPNGGDVSGKQIAPEVEKKRIQENLPKVFSSKSANTSRLILSDIYLPNGTRYIFAAQPPPLVYETIVSHWKVTLLRFSLTVLIISIVCLILSRRIIQPLTKLQNAVRAFAGGDLEARVDQEVLTWGGEIGLLAEEFNHMASRIDNLINEQKHLLQYVSHELRSPLARLQVAVELIRAKINTDAVQSEIERISLESERLDVLIGEILTLVRFESNHTSYPLIDCSLNKLLTAILADLYFAKPQMKERLHWDEIQMPCVMANETLARRAIENVLNNALKYTPEDARIELNLEETAQGYVALTITDYGSGVSEEALSMLTRPFYRAEKVQKNRQQKVTGFGLGLAITEQAMLRQNGQLTLSLPENAGLSVTLSFKKSSKTTR